MLRQALFASSLALFAGAATAQCADLSVTNTAGQVTIDLDGSTPMAFAFVLVGDTAGTTTVSLGSLGTLSLGLAAPFAPLPLGFTDMSGDVSYSFAVPASAPAGTYLLQGVTVGFGFTPGTGISLDLCASDVESLTI